MKAVEASQSWWVRPSCCYWSCSCWRSLLQYSCTLLAAIFERILHRGKVHGKDDDTLKLSRYTHYAQSSSLQLTQSVGLECASKETQSPSFALLPLLPTCNFFIAFVIEHGQFFLFFPLVIFHCFSDRTWSVLWSTVILDNFDCWKATSKYTMEY